MSSKKLFWTYCIILLSLISGIKVLGLTAKGELSIYNMLVRSQTNAKPDPRLLIVAITEEDIAEFGWPISDELLGNALAIIQENQPKVVGLDLYRNHRYPPGTSSLEAQLKRDNLVAVTFRGGSLGHSQVPAPEAVPDDRVGFNDLLVDPDGVVRRSLLVVGNSQRQSYSFAMRLSLKYADIQTSAIEYLDDRLVAQPVAFPALLEGSGGYYDLDAGGYQILLRYQGPDSPSREITFSEVLNRQFDPVWVKDKVVLVGSTADSLRDHFFTPYVSRNQKLPTRPGVVIHAQAISQILDVLAGEPAIFQFWPAWGEWLWLWACGATAFYLVWRIKNPLNGLWVSGLLVASIGTFGLILFNHLIWIPIVEPIVSVLLAGSLGVLSKLLYRIFYDPLTGLPNRELLLKTISASLNKNSVKQSDQPITVAFVNINRFRLINENMGYDLGDQLLLMFVDRLRAILPPSNFLSRIGDDEFSIIFKKFSFEEILTVINSLRKSLEKPFELSGQRVLVSATIGIASAQENRKHLPKNLLNEAQVALYRAKALGKPYYFSFSEDIQGKGINRLALESHLLDAIDQQDFVLYYQPIVHLVTGRLAGFETLIRWQRPGHGVVGPNDFIFILEETGLITQLGQWIFDEACRQLQEWRRRFPEYPELFVSINLSHQQFSDENLIDKVGAALKKHQLPGQFVRIEITESMVAKELENSLAMMQQLKSLNVKLSMDDFGTGYSSLNYLRQFPFDVLKIDKSFVGQMERSEVDQKIVETIVDLSHKLGLAVVAEGIETKEIADLLIQQTCEYGQGYYFSKPLPQQDAVTLLQSNLYNGYQLKAGQRI